MAKECSNSSCTKESCEGCPSKEGGGIQVKGHRLYPTSEEAETAIKKPKRAF